jgi:polyisoprenoid-binding protein YceI
MTQFRRLVLMAVFVAAPLQAQSRGPVRYLLAPEGNEARYRVREQLVCIDFPSDAVGRTSALTGSLWLGADGSLLTDSSRFTVDLTTLTSDRGGRDRYIKRTSLVTDSFPQAVLVFTGAKGLPAPLPTSGRVTFQLLGDFTVKSVTRPTTWDVTAELSAGVISGTAHTAFTFRDFGIRVPTVRMVLSVKDTIRVEYDFRLVRSS